MIAVYLTPFYIIYNILLCRLVHKWLKISNNNFFSKKYIQIIIYIFDIFCASSLLIANFVKNKLIKRILFNIGYWWLGYLIYATFVILIFAIIRLIMKKKMKKYKKVYTFRLGLIAFSLTIIICILGFLNAHHLTTTKYDIVIDKKTTISNLKIAMIADYHFGYNIGNNTAYEVAKMVNKENPDIILICGDIFDNDYDALDDPDLIIKAFKSMKSKYGIYAVYGNHDIDEPIYAGFTFSSSKKKESDIRMDELLEKANITLLKDEYKLIDNAFYLVGRPDVDRLNRGIDKRKNSSEVVEGINQNLPIIVMEHEPVELKELSNAGVDLDLNGHTHDGQIFPLKYLVKLKFDNTYGLKKYNNMYDIVTSGVGVFGVNMRVLTKAEITIINVKFGE